VSGDGVANEADKKRSGDAADDAGIAEKETRL
jgi:hypothetical protein